MGSTGYCVNMHVLKDIGMGGMQPFNKPSHGCGKSISACIFHDQGVSNSRVQYSYSKVIKMIN